MPETSSESLGQTQSIRRSVTLPTKLIPQTQRAQNLGENVIFYHPSAKIVHFAPKAVFPIPTSSTPTDFDYPVDTIETLPWRSATERTVATAPLRLEKVHGLTVFLKCGNVVHAILKNSQCWCVDGVSKFVLRIRPLTYYRIEIPFETEGDKELVEQLKAALPTVLRYEVTPCPFKRAFTVELPEEAIAPRRKRAWQPKGKRDSIVSISSSNRSPSEARSERPGSASTAEDTDGAATDDSGSVPKVVETKAAEHPDDPSLASTNTLGTPLHPKSGRRAFTETPQTFSTLRAKFDAPPAPEQHPISDDPLRERDVQDPIQEDRQPLDPRVPDAAQLSPQPKISYEPSVAEISVVNAPSLDNLTSGEFRNSLEKSEQDSAKGPVAQAPVAQPITEHRSSSGTCVTDIESETRARSSGLDSVPNESQHLEQQHSNFPPPSVLNGPEQVADLNFQESFEEISAVSVPDPDHDSSFSSSPDSFHSADFSSPANSLSPQTSPNGPREAYRQTRMSTEALPTENLSFEPPEASSALRPDIASISGSSSSGSQVATSSKFAFYESRSDRPTPSLAIQSDSRRPSQASLKAVSPATDLNHLNHMSSEFRHRAQATRHRDVSPMPPPSAIYQPSPREEASSILTKALALVLVPPVSLFIILLHITARIVISPTLGSSSDTSAKASHTSSRDSLAEDDFSFPLEREASSDYEDAQMSRKLDPWELD